MKQIVRLTESDLHRVIRESVNQILSELDWKTYANAAKKRKDQYKNNPADIEKWDKYLDLERAANRSFDDEYVDTLKYDTLGDKMAGKQSPKFKANINLNGSPYSAIKGKNKSGDEIFSSGKGKYHSSKGVTTPRNFFKDPGVAASYEKANDELWDYHNGNYDYDKENGWHLKN